MKIGSAITFLFSALIALGFLISDNINARKELIQVKQQNLQLSRDLKTFQTKLDMANNSLAASEQKITELTGQNDAQRQQIGLLTDKIENLEAQNYVLQSQTKAVEFFNDLWSSSPRSLSMAFFLPIIPFSMAATYVIVRYNNNHRQKKNMLKKSQRRIMVQLTDDEVKEIIRIRRSK